MKLRLYIIMLLASVSLCSIGQTIGEAFYIYRNDGQFNAFFRDEVDSIVFSHYDADSVFYNEVVMQVVYTPDSLYRIPLAAIDSIGFVQPKKEFQPDVMRMNEKWLPYVIGITEKSITFKPSTPIDLLPRKGQVMVSETFESPFETGFSGRVIRIDTYSDSIVCTVEDVLLSDIYKRLVAVGLSYSENTEEDVSSARRKIFGINTETGIRFPIPPIVNLSVGPVSISCAPVITMKYIVCLWEHNLKDYVEICFHQVYDGSVSFNAKLEKPFTPSPKWAGPGITVPTPVPGLYGRVQVGGFFRSSGSVQLSATKKFHREGKSGFIYSENSGFKAINEWDNPSKEDWEASVSIDGSISAGFAGRLEFGIAHKKLASADITLYAGLEISGHAELKATDLVVDKNLYSSIKDSEITLSIIADVVPGYQLLGFKSSKVMPEPPKHQDTPVSLKFTRQLNHWYLVPEFDNLKWQADVNGGNLSGDVSRNLLSRVSLGWGLYDEEDHLYKSEYYPQMYRKLADWRYNGLSHHFSNLKKNANYKAYPLVNLCGIEMRGDKSVEIDTYFPVALSDFEVTDAKYAKGTFTNDGYNYDYRFDVTVKANIKSLNGVRDWGYVYRDPNGREKEISLMQFGDSKIDNRYAYFRNQPKSTCILYGYVKYEGSEEPLYGEPQEFPLIYEGAGFLCPDSNHPHMIDLGLPSGTKWACCNVGASKPEDCGSYYAWGELTEKSSTTWDNYQYGTWETVQNIGSDISGSQYDVAHVKWGGLWKMPTYSQIKELVNNCSYEWTELNGMNGYLFKGSNCNSIFLPATGRQWEGVYGIGIGANYWSSTLNAAEIHSAYILGFDNSGVSWDGGRAGGRSVRPVSK